jgi:hypothetical protein
MDIISPNKVLQLKYHTKKSDRIMVDVDCSKETEVWVVPKKGLTDFFGEGTKVSSYARSQNKTHHQLSFTCVDENWYLLICNTSEENVYVSARVNSQ